MEQVLVWESSSRDRDKSDKVRAFSVIFSLKSILPLVSGSFLLVIYSTRYAPAAILGRGPLMVVSK
jgi:hypothetical protein